MYVRKRRRNVRMWLTKHQRNPPLMIAVQAFLETLIYIFNTFANLYLMRLQYLWCIGLQSDCNLWLLVYDRKREEEEKQPCNRKKKKKTPPKTNGVGILFSKKIRRYALSFL